MTVTTMLANFLVEYDAVASASSPLYSDEEIIQFLNRAQYDIVDMLYRAKEFDLLDGLIVTDTNAAPAVHAQFVGVAGEGAGKTSDTSGGGFTRYLYYVASYSEVTRTQVPVMAATIIKNTEIDKSQARFFATSAFNSPIFRYPKSYVDGVYVVVIPDAYSTISKIYVDYVSNPKELSATVSDASHTTTCQLRESLHEEVVTKAVQLAQVATNPQMAEANIKLTNKP